jgi:hypothetical protein
MPKKTKYLVKFLSRAAHFEADIEIVDVSYVSEEKGLGISCLFDNKKLISNNPSEGSFGRIRTGSRIIKYPPDSSNSLALFKKESGLSKCSKRAFE